jgi:hypothetical protein
MSGRTRVHSSGIELCVFQIHRGRTLGFHEKSEEKAALFRRLANRSVGEKLAAAYEEEAAACDKHVESIRRMLIEKQEDAA